MSRLALWTAVAIAAAVQVAGCKKADDEFAPAVVPKSYSFEGQVDSKFAGTWKSADGSSTLDIVKDGKVEISTVTRSVAGKATSHISGKWLASADSLMFQYVLGSQAPTVVKYTATLVGNSLTLQQADGRAKVVYKRS